MVLDGKCFVDNNRFDKWFSKLFHSRRIETCSQALSSLCSIFEQTNIVRGKCDRKSLFVASKKCSAIDLFDISRAIDQTPFYGRVAGFHVRKQKSVNLSSAQTVFRNNRIFFHFILIYFSCTVL